MKFWRTTDLNVIDGRERTYSIPITGFYLVHWENYHTSPVMSTPSPVHTWRFSRGKSWSFALSYGYAPYKSMEQDMKDKGIK